IAVECLPLLLLALGEGPGWELAALAWTARLGEYALLCGRALPGPHHLRGHLQVRADKLELLQAQAVVDECIQHGYHLRLQYPRQAGHLPASFQMWLSQKLLYTYGTTAATTRRFELAT
ncbi:MAG: hypothetical protein COV10_04130, partial [Candidatus Vogelbacteria bacterium CG10_big_fil_rev_8_21_14_0_10_51_16]